MKYVIILYILLSSIGVFCSDGLCQESLLEDRIDKIVEMINTEEQTYDLFCDVYCAFDRILVMIQDYTFNIPSDSERKKIIALIKEIWNIDYIVLKEKRDEYYALTIFALIVMIIVDNLVVKIIHRLQKRNA